MASTGRTHRTRRSAWSWASRRCARASSGSRWPTSVRRGPSGVRRPHSCRSTPWPINRCGRRGRGRPSTVGRSLAAVEPSMARDGRVVQLVDGGAEALAAVAIGAASAGYRVVVARQSDPDDAGAGVIELVPPGAAVPPGPRTRANVALPIRPAGRATPTSSRARASSLRPTLRPAAVLAPGCRKGRVRSGHRDAARTR